MAIRLECFCGEWIEASDEAAAGLVTCAGCGAEFDLRGALDDPAPVEIASFADAKLQCPSCGGLAEVVGRGEAGRDRMLSCLYCGSEVDLPERRGTTRERVTERPGERVIERVTSWENLGPDVNPLLTVPEGGGETFEVDERSFDSMDAMERHLREQLPEGMAEQALDALRQAMRDGNGGSASAVIEHNEVLTERTPVTRPAKARRR